MPDHDAALDEAIRDAGAILGDALVQLLFPESADFPVSFLETRMRQLPR